MTRANSHRNRRFPHGLGLAALLLAQTPHTAMAVDVNSVWEGGTGFWSDTLNWNPNLVPNNDGNNYSVFIDNGDTGTSSSVTLDLVGVDIDHLSIDAGDTLDIQNRGSLTIVNSGAGTGGIVNVGRLSLSSTRTGTFLNFAGDQTLGGTGEVVMGDSPFNIIQTTGDTTLTHGAGHTIRGAGQLRADTGGIVNDGTIIAQGTGALSIIPEQGSFTNNNVLQAAGSGGLSLVGGPHVNNTTIQVLDGSRLQTLVNATVQGGKLSTAGSGVILPARGSTLDGVTNLGRVQQANIQNVNIVNGLTNDGTWEMNSTGGGTFLTFAGDQTLGGTGEVVMGDSPFNIIQTTGDTTLTHGAGHTIRGAGQLRADTGGIVNDGTIIAQGTGALSIIPEQGSFTNNNVLQAAGSGGLSLVGGPHVNNTTIQVLDGSRLQTLVNATVQGGKLSTAGSGVILPARGSTLDGVTNLGRVQQANIQNVNIVNGLTNDGTWEMNSTGGGTFLTFAGDQTLGGTGEVVMGDSPFNIIQTTGDTTLTHGAGHTIRGAGQLRADTGGIVNDGTIIAQGTGALSIIPEQGSFTNNNVLQAAGSGGLSLVGGPHVNNTTIQVLDGSRLQTLVNATVQGGKLSTAGSGVILPARGSTLDGVTNLGRVQQANIQNVNIVNGLTNDGTWEMNSTGGGTFLTFAGDQTLGGTGEVVMGDSPFNIIQTTGDTTLTHGAGHTIRGAGQLRADTGGIVNDGTIIAQGTGALSIIPEQGSFTNNNVLQAAGSGGLSLVGGPHVNNTTIQVLDGSRLQTLVNATVQGGKLSTAGSGVILPARGSTLDGVTNLGRVQQANIQNVNIVNGLTNDGTWEMNSTGGGTFLTFAGDQTLGGTGEVVMGDSPFNIIQTTGGTVIQGADHTIEGTGQIAASLDNKGTVHANQAAGIILNTNAKVNDGTFKASNGATLTVGVDVSGSGDWVADGGMIQLNAGVNASGGDITVKNGGELELNNANITATHLTMGSTGTLDVGSTVSLSGDLSFAMTNESLFVWDAGATLEMTGGVGGAIGDWPDWARLEIGGLDQGTDPDNHVGAPAGFVDNFSLSELVIGGDAHVLLQDLLDNGNRGGPFGMDEALYVDTLTFADGLGRLNVNGLHLYYNNLFGDVDQIFNSPIPLPPAVWLLGSALVGLGLVRRRRVAA